MLTSGLPREFCDGHQQRPDRSNAIYQALAYQGGPAGWFALLSFDDQGFKPCAQLGVRHGALGAQGHEFGQ